jgi:hypothetical protein
MLLLPDPLVTQETKKPMGNPTSSQQVFA